MRAVVGLLIASVVAGCFGGDGSDTEDESALFPRDLPPGCDGAHTTVAHTAGGILVDASIDPIVACFHPIGAQSLEPTIGIDSAGTVYFYPADYYIPEDLLIPSPIVRMARSSDDGATWEILTPNVEGIPTHPYSSDPYLYLDPTTDRVFAEDLLLMPPTCGMLSISDDRGETWTHTQSGCMAMDHQTLFAGPPATSTTSGYPNVVYRCALSGGGNGQQATMVVCQRSLDGGMRWLPHGDPAFTFLPGMLEPAGPTPGPLQPCSAGSGHGVVGPHGTVYLPRGHCGHPWLAISRDEGMTWTRVQVSDLGLACADGVDGSSDCQHDAGFGIDANGTFYYAWHAEDRLLYLVRSFDGGVTWDEPQMIAAPGLDETNLVQLAAGGAGKIGIAYVGTSESPGTPFTGDYAETTWGAYMAVSYDADSANPAFHSAAMHDLEDPLVRGPCHPRCQALYDFIDIRIAPDGTPWATFVDGCFDGCPDGNGETSEGVAGRLWGGPSLWDDADPNGPYP